MVLVEVMLAQHGRQWPIITSDWANVSFYLVKSGMESVTHIVTGMQQSENSVQSPDAVSMSGQRRRLWVNIETALGKYHVSAQSIRETQ